MLEIVGRRVLSRDMNRRRSSDPPARPREQTMPQKTARENEIARENEPPHGNDDMAVLRDDELDAITGGVGKTIGAKAKIIDGRFTT